MKIYNYFIDNLDCWQKKKLSLELGRLIPSKNSKSKNNKWLVVKKYIAISCLTSYIKKDMAL